MSQSPYTHSCTERPRLPCPACCWAEVVCDECTVVLFRPVSARARAWINENVQYELWQWLSDSLAVEHHYAPAIVEAMLGESLFLASESRDEVAARWGVAAPERERAEKIIREAVAAEQKRSER